MPAPANASDIFDVDAWLLEMGVVPAPQKQAPPATPSPVTNVTGNQHLYEAQHGSQNGSAGGSRPHSSGSDSSRMRYRPPHMRADTDSNNEAVSTSQLPTGNTVSHSSGNGMGRKLPPPGFSASAVY